MMGSFFDFSDSSVGIDVFTAGLCFVDMDLKGAEFGLDVVGTGDAG